MNYIEYTSSNEIMACDVFISIQSSNHSKQELNTDIEKTLESLKSFEQKYSRFINNNYLTKFNSATEMDVTNEFRDIIELCKKYYIETNKLFDPTIYNSLVNEGYNVSKLNGYYDGTKKPQHSSSNYTLDDLKLKNNNKVVKPSDLKLDLGGIGKSYIVKKISDKLLQKYRNFCLSVGGDLVVYGKDKKHKYDYWVIDIELPSKSTEQITLLVSNMGIATSGTYKRKWIKNNIEKNHIIDPRKATSTKSSIVSSTVINKDLVFADVFAKTLLLLDTKKALEYCVERELASIFITKTGRTIFTPDVQKYVWKN